MLALLILGGVGVYAVVWQTDETAQKKERKRAEQAVFSERVIKNVKAAAVDGPKQTISFVRNDQDKWLIQTPIMDEADQAAVNSLLRYMLGAKRVREVGDEQDGVVTPPQDLSLYGLDKPNYRFSFTTVTGETQELLIGRETRFDKNYYAKRAQSPEVFLIEYGLQFQYERELDGFRDKRFLELPLAKVQKLEVKSSASSWLVEKRDDKFWVVKPVKALADKEQVEGVLGVLESLEIKGFLNEPRKLPKQLKNTVEVIITNTDDQETTLKLSAYDEDSTALVYASAQGVAARKPQAMLQIDAAIARLQIDPQKLEDRRIARFENDLVTGVRVFKDDLSMLFKKTSDGFWRLEGEERAVKAGVVQGLLYNLRRLKADKLGVQEPNEEQLKQAGFETKNSGIELFGQDSESLTTVYIGKTVGENLMVLSADGRLDRVKQADLSMLYFDADPYLQPSP